jgi:predicted ATP-dependent serine protease
MAGVMTLQHHVDTTMTIEPDPDLIVEEEAVRVQDIMKNRFGRAFIQQEYVMTARGLKVYIPPEEPEENEEDEDENDE